MTQMHFHVDLHDIGYQPDSDAVSTHLTIDGALDEATTRAEEIIDALSELDPKEIIRGQALVGTITGVGTDPVTNEAEIEAIDAQVKSILNAIATDEDYSADIALKGMLIVIEDGIAVIELVPCSEDTCETYRKEWIE